LAAAYDAPGNLLLLKQATAATQLALYRNSLLKDEAAGRPAGPEHEPTLPPPRDDGASQRESSRAGFASDLD
jgi:hypothetical protein